MKWIVVFIVLAAWPSQAAEAMGCLPRPEMVKQLKIRYAEAPVAMGLQSGGDMVEVFASPQGNTWSIVSTSPRGFSCLVVHGQSWETLPQIGQDS